MFVQFKFALGAAALAVLSGATARAETFSQYGVWNAPSFGQERRAVSPSFPQATLPAARATAAPYWRPINPENPMVADGGDRPDIVPEAPPLVMVNSNNTAGTILIDTSARKLYRVNGDGTAFAYPIGVGKEGFAWSGTEKVSRIAAWPDWYPPAEMRARKPGLPEKMMGGLLNPLGAKAIYLGNSLYRIHGTDAPQTVGRAESSGCIRMLNAHVVHLASLVDVGTTVIVAPALDPGFVVAEIPKPQPVRTRYAASR